MPYAWKAPQNHGDGYEMFITDGHKKYWEQETGPETTIVSWDEERGGDE